jgi:hypothetical protein
MPEIFNNFKNMTLPRAILLMAVVALWIACYIVNQKAMESLNNHQMNEMKNQVQDLRNIVWALYAVYLLNYFINVYRPLNGMLTGSSNVSVIGIVLTTILVLCITHLSAICNDVSCDMATAVNSLEKMNILLSILVVVHIGTIVVFSNSPVARGGFTAEILDLLRTPPKKSKGNSILKGLFSN